MSGNHYEPSTSIPRFEFSARHSGARPRLQLGAGRLASFLANGRGNEESQSVMLDGLRPGTSEVFISLNEVIQNGRTRIETKSTERYFSPEDVGQQRPTIEATHEVRHVQYGPSHEREASASNTQEHPMGGVRREETFHSTTTLVGSSRASIAEEDVPSDVPTIRIWPNDDDESEDEDGFNLYAMSPILGVRRLPSAYDVVSRNASSSSNHALPRASLSSPLPVGSPPTSTQPAPPTIEGTLANETTPATGGASETPPSQPASTTEPQASDNPSIDRQSQQSNGGLVESSVLLQVSIVNRSSDNLPISIEHEHSTLEYVQFIETASYRQYSFTSEQLEVPHGFLRRSTSGLRRILSARNRFIGARSRSFLKRLQREVDLELHNPDAAWQEPNNQPDGPVELDTNPAGPYEVAVTPTNENWGRWGARAELQRDGTFTRLETLSRMTCAIFGPNLPRELGPMCKVYMKQLDEQLTTSMKNHELQTPNTLSWPNPLAYVEECLKIVASRMESGMSIEDFVQRNMTHLMLLMEEGPGAARLAPNPEHNPVLNTDYLKIAHEWMLFCLEAWTMLDMTAICKNRHDLRLSDNFCKSLLKDTIESLLPRLIAKYTHHNSTAYTYSVGKANQIFPHEMTAEMLQELGGITFVWTHDITKHLYLDTKLKTVALFSHVAFAYLHAESGTDSSLNKSGLIPYHHLLTEIAESYRLLFGSSERSRKLFHNIDPEGRSPGYFDIFSLHSRLDSIKPKWLYSVNDDFMVFGDRLVELRSLLKPKGLRGLWRDTRDSLQWYTFWAVAVIGAISLLLGLVQMALGAVQAYASLKALGP